MGTTNFLVTQIYFSKYFVFNRGKKFIQVWNMTDDRIDIFLCELFIRLISWIKLFQRGNSLAMLL